MPSNTSAIFVRNPCKARGVYRGRKPSIDVAEVKRLKEFGLGPTAIARKLGIGRASVYRALEAG